MTSSRLLLAFAVGSTMGLAAGCQTYDFEPVEPGELTLEPAEPQELTLTPVGPASSR